MNHDAIVIGGGPAGTTVALLLARAGWSVALVERKSFPRRKVCGEYLSATNLPLFDHLATGLLFRPFGTGCEVQVSSKSQESGTSTLAPSLMLHKLKNIVWLMLYGMMWTVPSQNAAGMPAV